MNKLRTGKAPGHPGADSNWASSRKTGTGQACNFISRTAFTVGDGILNECYFPRLDLPCIKDCGLIVTDGKSMFSEEKRDVDSEIRWAAEGVPAFLLTNTDRQGRYRIHKEIVADPLRAVVLQRIRFEQLSRSGPPLRLYALLAPHLGDQGVHNNASFGTYKGAPLLFAESCECALAFACSSGWHGRSVGFIGESDGWQDLSRHFELLWHYDSAKDGNVALTGEIHLPADGRFVLAVGFGRNTNEAACHTRASLAAGFDTAWNQFASEWQDWQRQLAPLDKAGDSRLYRASTTILRTHEDTDFRGARVASLSVPWGEAQKQEHAGGYHEVWARDCAQSALGLLAAGAPADAMRTLDYLREVQEADGHWAQAMWIDGSAYWKNIQIDSIAAPSLLYEIARQEGVFAQGGAEHHHPLVLKAAEFICRNGPITQQDRWERNSGFSVYTLALAVGALVIAAQAARDDGRGELAEYLLETADAWNAQIDNWTWSTGSELAKKRGVEGLYCRIVQANDAGVPQFDQEYELENSQSQKYVVAREVVSPDVWALVRYGLRAPDDERIRATTELIDATLRTDTPRGPVWHRYTHDGYGETQEGEPFSKKGIGRGWPLLVGERAHYELARGDTGEAWRLFDVLENFGGDVRLLSEQVWDSADLPEKGLLLGHATGSARPLAWTHSEHLQLLRSLRDGRVFNCPRLVAERYAGKSPRPAFTPWRVNLQTPTLIMGTKLRIERTGPFRLSWSSDHGAGERESRPSPVALHYLDLPTEQVRTGDITFVFHDDQRDRWEETTYRVAVG
jgi:glucoamylase